MKDFESKRSGKARSKKNEESGCEEGYKRSVIRALTEAQGHYILSIKNKTITFGVGSAGTGKTWVAAAMACDEFANKSVGQIIITRPAVEVGKSFGATPGFLHEKFMPYIMPVYDVMQQRIGKSQLEYAMKSGQIKAVPLEFMRGLSFDDSWIILDEAQNSTPEQMLMLLTRIGQNCKLIINGDPRQSDIKRKSGLDDAMEKLRGLADVGFVEFEIDDIVRSGIVREILIRYTK